MRRVTLVPLCALLAAACQDAPMQPTSAEGGPPPTATFAASLAPGEPNASVLAVTAALEDATTRLVAALEDRGAARQLGTHLDALSAHLAAGDRVRAERALTLAQSALSRASDRLGDAADGASIQLALDGADALLHGAHDEQE
jgi:hypothetical protein